MSNDVLETRTTSDSSGESTPPSKRPWYRKKRVVVPVAFFAAMMVIGSLSGHKAAPSAAKPSAHTVQLSAAAKAEAARQAAAKAEAARQAAAKAAAAQAAAAKAAAAKAAAEKAAAAKAAAAKAAAARAYANRPYLSMTSRQFALLAKNPDAYSGERFVVYGQVTQFDAATGDDTFRADTGAVKLYPDYGYVDYNTNTVLSGDVSKLSNVVEGDLFRASVEVVGSYSYDTQIGGNTTVPQLQVDAISVYSHVDN